MRHYAAIAAHNFFRKLLPASLACFCITTAGYAQDTTTATIFPRAWKISFNVETGYTSFTLSDARLLFDQILTTYRQKDIPLPSQTTFPGNMLIGGSLMFSAVAPFSIGIGGYYSRTTAVSSYRDYSGTLLERMDVDLATLYMSVQFMPFRDLPALYLCAHPGVGYSQISYLENVNMIFPTPQFVSTRVTGHGVIIVGDAGLGVHFRIFNFPAAAEADYREGKLSRLTDTEGYIQVPLDISGFVFKLRIGIGL